ncbi:MAG: glycoside hydrolase family 15 protein [Bryobacteraceae bacterium]
MDPERGGCWQICPAEDFKVSRQYVENTNVVETRFETANGVLRLTDFMPAEGFKRTHLCVDHEVLRIVECLSGEVTVQVTFDPRPNYGEQKVKFNERAKLGLRVNAGRGMLTLHSQLTFTIEGAARVTVRLRTGETLPFSLTYTLESPAVLPVLEQSGEVLERTIRWWKDWANQFTYDGPYREAVLRSILTLKLLEFAPSGAFVAAVTTSLPEKVGSDLNWDYRYCWLRDASLTIRALCETGYKNEAESFAEWMLHATRLTQPELMVMYDVYGNLAKPERTLLHMPGYRGSSPVRVGNQARKQLQLDTYGEVICGSSRLIKSNGYADRETAKVLTSLGKYVCGNWRHPDAGIWEPRDAPAAHTHSRLLCWVALDELLQLHDRGLLNKAPMDMFKNTRDEIRRDIELNSWNEEIGSYTSKPGETTLDATLLLIALHNFEPISSIRLRRTFDRVKQKLGAGGPLLYRYRIEQYPEEGAFGICSFWAAEYLAMGGGSLEEAKRDFEALLRYANDLGLYAEEIDPITGAALGKLPSGIHACWSHQCGSCHKQTRKIQFLEEQIQ